MVLVSFLSEGRGLHFFLSEYILVYHKLFFIRWTFKQLKDLFLITSAHIFVVKTTHVNVRGGYTPYWWGTKQKKSRMVLKRASFQYYSIQMKLNFNCNGGLVLILKLSLPYVNINIFLRFFCHIIVSNIFKKMLPSWTVVAIGLDFWYNKSNIMYMFCNKPFKAFLESQMYKNKPTPFLATYSFNAVASHLFLHIVIFYSLRL